MTSIIKFTPLSGALTDGPSCYLLQVDDFKFMLDCGWNETFDEEVLENIRKHLPQVNAILLSHSDLQHIGALPALLDDIPWTCAIYATVPVFQMGQLTLYDQFSSYDSMDKFTKYTLNDVDALFKRIVQVKVNQMIPMDDGGRGLCVTPMHAGRLVGGAAWKIMTADEEGEIIYAVDFNHKRDRHLNKCSFVDTDSLSGRPPQLLITDAYNASYTHKRRKDRDEQLLSTIQQTLRNDGNVLIVADSAGRVLELAVLLDLFWSSGVSNLSSFSLAMISHVAYNVVQFAKTMVEWMCDDIANMMTDSQNSPFNFKYLTLCHSLKSLAQTPQPRCVLASTGDMESGLSRQLFVQWCSDPRNAVIVTNRTAKGTLARTLYDNPSLSHIKLKMSRHEPIIGEELTQYEREQNRKRKLEKNDRESSDDSDTENTTIGGAKNNFVVKVEPTKKSGGFFKQAKKNLLMFPYSETRIKWDDYGEFINPEDFRMNEINAVEEILPAKKEKSENAEMMEKKLEEKQEEAPFRVVHETVELDIKCKVEYIDFEGRSDGQSLLKIVKQMNPREVILVRGLVEPTLKFAKDIRGGHATNNTTTSSKPQIQVFTPSVNEVVDTTKQRHIYQVRMTDSLMNSFQFIPVKDAEICWIDAKADYTQGIRDNAQVLSAQEIQDARLRGVEAFLDQVEKMDVDPVAAERKLNRSVSSITDDFDYSNSIPSLQPLSIDETPGHRTCHVNELRLSDFKTVLVKEGIQAEFIGGVLVCNNLIAIRRNQQGVIDMEGALSEDYFHIRDLLYKQYAVI